VRPADACRWDVVALGEVLLRLDPGDRRIATTRRFDVWEGGGEYNVARALTRCFGLRGAIVTALADNDVGRLVEDLMYQGGVDRAHLRWVPYDGVGRTVRNGINFVERGIGVRAARGVSDRGHTAASQLRPGDVDWDAILGDRGARWLHCGGVFAALSDTTAAVAQEAMEAAHRHGTLVSYDLNYRPSLWQGLGGAAQADRVNDVLLEHVDVVFGVGIAPSKEGTECFEALAERHLDALEAVMERHPGLDVAASTVRAVHSASVNDWGAVCRTRDAAHVGPSMQRLEIHDRVGGGDSFASGFIYGVLTGEPVDRSLAYGVAHGALAMTTPGDASMASLEEVRRLMSGDTARILR
jgi:2-dehydro-3-deoxygluconokinase